MSNWNTLSQLLIQFSSFHVQLETHSSVCYSTVEMRCQRHRKKRNRFYFSIGCISSSRWDVAPGQVAYNEAMNWIGQQGKWSCQKSPAPSNIWESSRLAVLTARAFSLGAWYEISLCLPRNARIKDVNKYKKRKQALKNFNRTVLSVV